MLIDVYFVGIVRQVRDCRGELVGVKQCVDGLDDRLTLVSGSSSSQLLHCPLNSAGRLLHRPDCRFAVSPM